MYYLFNTKTQFLSNTTPPPPVVQCRARSKHLSQRLAAVCKSITLNSFLLGNFLLFCSFQTFFFSFNFIHKINQTVIKQLKFRALTQAEIGIGNQVIRINFMFCVLTVFCFALTVFAQ